jgi:hypothetical protein
MDKNTEQLKAELEQTKADLREKAAEFESRLREDVSSAKESVEGAIQNVQTVAAGLSFKKLVQKKPLLMLGGSVMTGIVAGRMLAPRSRETIINSGYSEKGPSISARIQDRFPDEVRILKTMAYGYLLNMVTEKAKSAFPESVEKISDIEQRIKTNIRGPTK